MNVADPIKQAKYIENRNKGKNKSESARLAGYSPKSAHTQATKIEKRIAKLGVTGLDALERVAKAGRNELAIVNAGKVLVETAYGKPAPPQSKQSGDIIVNITRIEAPPPKHIIDQVTQKV